MKPAPVSRQLPALAGWLALCFAAAALGGLAGAGPGAWYASLQKPSWNPPAWIFGPVWTVLYTLMALCAWLVWRRGGWTAQRGPLRLFLFQLALNAAWTPLFFGLHQPGWALLDILLLLATIAATIRAFWPIHRPAALLLLPYLAWIAFATLLNFTLWRMNP